MEQGEEFEVAISMTCVDKCYSKIFLEETLVGGR